MFYTTFGDKVDFLVAQVAKNPPVMRETWARSLDVEDPLQDGMAPVFLPGEFAWTEESGRLQSIGSKRVRHD